MARWCRSFDVKGSLSDLLVIFIFLVKPHVDFCECFEVPSSHKVRRYVLERQAPLASPKEYPTATDPHICHWAQLWAWAVAPAGVL